MTQNSWYASLQANPDIPQIDACAFGQWVTAQAAIWRQSKADEEWPWRHIISSGAARIEYLRGIIWENYHYVRAATWRQATAVIGDMPSMAYEKIRDFIAVEANHDKLFKECLQSWGISQKVLERSVPLPGTRLFIDHQRSLGIAGPLHYCAGTVITEIHPEIYERLGGPYDAWQKIYGIDPGILEPINSHVRADVDAGHGSLFATILECYGTISIEMAEKLLISARYTFEAMRIWQREMFEHYHIQAKKPLNNIEWIPRVL